MQRMRKRGSARDKHVNTLKNLIDLFEGIIAQTIARHEQHTSMQLNYSAFVLRPQTETNNII